MPDTKFEAIKIKIQDQIGYQMATCRGGIWHVTLRADEAEWLVERLEFFMCNKNAPGLQVKAEQKDQAK